MALLGTHPLLKSNNNDMLFMHDTDRSQQPARAEHSQVSCSEEIDARVALLQAVLRHFRILSRFAVLKFVKKTTGFFMLAPFLKISIT